MKPPPLVLVAALSTYFSLVNAHEDKCKEIKEKISFLDHYEESFDVYVYQHEDELYQLFCFSKSDIMTIKIVKDTSNFQHIVTIKGFSCEETKIQKELYFYKNLKEKIHILGIFVESQWCKFDLSQHGGIPHITSNANPTVEVFNWSKKSSNIPLENEWEFSTHGTYHDPATMIAEYVSVGRPPTILNCYEKSLRIRTPVGRLIYAIDDAVKCTDEFIQAFYISRLNYDVSKNKQNELMYQLGMISKWDKWSWLYTTDYMHTWANYFIAKNTESKNCIWKRIPNQSPNSCVLLKHDDFIVTDEDYEKFHQENQLNREGIYYNFGRLKLTLSCFTYIENGDKKYVSVVADTNGNHVITIKRFDCSSIQGTLFVDTEIINGIRGTEFLVIVVGSRRSTTNTKRDSWCSYSIIKHTLTNEKGKYSKTYTWVYYGYKPKEEVESWTPVSKETTIDFNGIRTSNQEIIGAEVIDIYLSVKNSEYDDILLECSLKEGKYYGVIKTFSNKIITVIPGLPCKRTEHETSWYMYYFKHEQKVYLGVGRRFDVFYDWYSYERGLNSDNEEAKLSLKPFTTEKDIIKWSKAGTIWRKPGEKDYTSQEKITRFFVTNNLNSFVLMGLENNNENMILRNMRGTRFAEVPLGPSFKGSTFEIQLKFIEEKQEGESLSFNYIDCTETCEKALTEGNNKITLFFFNLELASLKLDRFQFMEQAKESCEFKERGDILATEQNFANGQPENTYFTGTTPEFQLKCYTGGAAITLNNKHVFTWKNFDCSNKGVKEFTIHTIDGVENNEGIIVGRMVRQITYTPPIVKSKKWCFSGWRREKKKQTEYSVKWCWYNLVINENKIYLLPYYGYKAGYATQWYSLKERTDPKNCPGIKKADIITEKHDLQEFESAKAILSSTYAGELERSTVILNFYSYAIATVRTLEIISEKGKSVMVKNLVRDLAGELDRLHIFYFQPSSESYYLALFTGSDSSRGSGSLNWCRYDICLTCEKKEIWLSLSEDAPPLAINWSKPGCAISSRPDFYVAHSKINPQIGAVKDDLKGIFYSRPTKNFGLKFQIRCYRSGPKTTAIITTPRGAPLGGVAVDCMQKRFSKVYIRITRNKKEIFSGYIKTDKTENEEFLCWYYGCEEQADPTEEVTIYYFFEPAKGSSGFDTSNLSDESKPDVCIDGWCRVRNIGKDIGESSQMRLKSEEIKFDGKKSEGFELVANFIQESHPQFELRCYHYKGDYYAYIMNKDGKYIVSILNHNCMRNNAIRVTVDIKDPHGGSGFVFVQTGTRWFSFYQELFTAVILYGYNPGTTSEWKRVPKRENCPLKLKNIYFDAKEKSQFKLVARHRNSGESDYYYELYCYEVSDRSYISEIRRFGSYRVSLKGLDCSNDKILNSMTYVTSDVYELGETLVVGAKLTRGTLRLPDEYCQFFVKYPEKTITFATSMDYTDSGRFRWIQIPMEDPVKSNDIHFNENEITVKEGSRSARYLSDNRDFILYCYESDDSRHVTRIKKSGDHAMSIQGIDCSSSDKIMSLYVGVDLKTVGYRLTTIDSVDKLWCMYKIEWTPEGATVELTSKKIDAMIEWTKIPTDDPTNRYTISTVDTGMVKQDEEPVTRYLSIDEVYFLGCYKKDDAPDHILVINKIKLKEHILTIKGFDCSSNKKLHSELKIKIYGGDEVNLLMTIYIEDDSKSCWWIYDVSKSGAVTVKPTLSSKPSGMIEWSEEEITLQSDEDTLKGSVFERVAMFSYKDNLGLECYKKPYTAEFYVKLRGSRGFFIAAVPYPRDCTVGENLMKQAYIQVRKEEEAQFLRLDQEEIVKQVFELLKDSARQEFRFYYFVKTSDPSNHGRMNWEKVDECSVIRKKQIHTTGIFPTTPAEKETKKYKNGSTPPVTLTCFTYYGDEYAVISVDSKTINLERYYCMSENQFKIEMFSIENHGPDIILGRKNIGSDDWCWVIIPHETNEPAVQFLDKEHTASIESSLWYKVDYQNECPMLKRANIVIDPGVEEFSSETSTNTYIVDVKNTDKSTETFILYCLQDSYENTIGKLMIGKVEGKDPAKSSEENKQVAEEYVLTNLVLLKEYNCKGGNPLQITSYVFTVEITDPTDRKPVLAIGTRRDLSEKWCEFHTNMPEKGLSSVHMAKEPKLREFDWTLPGKKIKSKSSWNALSGYEDKMDVRTYIYSGAGEPGERYFILECYPAENTGHEHPNNAAILRTNKGLFITEININCHRDDTNMVDLRYIVVEKSDKSQKLIPLNFKKPPARGKDSCWFYGCDKYEDKVMIFTKDLNKKDSSRFWIKAFSDDQNTECQTVGKLDETKDEFQKSFKLVAEHKYALSESEETSFNLKCYIKMNSSVGKLPNSHYVLDIWDQNGTPVTRISNFPCHSISILREVFDIYMEYNVEEVEDDNKKLDFTIIDLESQESCPQYSFILCPKCNVKRWNYYKSHSKNEKSKWTQIKGFCDTLLDNGIDMKNQGETFNPKTCPAAQSYISEGDKDGEILILTCYTCHGDRFVIQLRTLSGQHVATFDTTDCYSQGKNKELDLSSDSPYYLLIKRAEEKTYLTFVANARKQHWCKYDVCIDCPVRTFSVTTIDDKNHEISSRMMIWSMEGGQIQGSPNTQGRAILNHNSQLFKHVNKDKITWCQQHRKVVYEGLGEYICEDCFAPNSDYFNQLGDVCQQVTKWDTRDKGKDKIFSKHVNVANENLEMECVFNEDLKSISQTTVKGLTENGLVMFSFSHCTLSMNHIYVYTLYEDETYVLWKMNLKKPQDSGSSKIKHQAVYVFDQELVAGEAYWNLVSGIDTSVFKSVDHAKANKECFPQAKQPKELQLIND